MDMHGGAIDYEVVFSKKDKTGTIKVKGSETDPILFSQEFYKRDANIRGILRLAASMRVKKIKQWKMLNGLECFDTGGKDGLVFKHGKPLLVNGGLVKESG